MVKAKLYEYKGKRLTISEWEEFLNIPCRRLRNRIDKGMSIKDAIEKPITVDNTEKKERNRKIYNSHNKDPKKYSTRKLAKEYNLAQAVIQRIIKRESERDKSQA